MDLTRTEFLDRVNYYGKVWWGARDTVAKVIQVQCSELKCNVVKIEIQSIGLQSCEIQSSGLQSCEIQFTSGEVPVPSLR